MVKRYVVIINLCMRGPVLLHYLLDWHIGGSWLKVDRFRFNRLLVMRVVVNRVMVWRNIDGFESVLMGRTW